MFIDLTPEQRALRAELRGYFAGLLTPAEAGEAVTGQVGEMVITQPMPSMPVCLWNDDDGELYRRTYFADFPGVWRQGDFFKVNERGGCFVLGRSDATLNRFGVRIGTAEIYAALESVEEVADALIVNLDLPGGGFFMPLFVTLTEGAVLDDALRRKIGDRLRTLIRWAANRRPAGSSPNSKKILASSS